MYIVSRKIERNDPNMIKHERNKHITLDKDRHIYRYKGDKEFQGVTSWIGKYNEPFDAEAVARKLAKWKDQTAEEILASWEATREYGDYVHENVETYVKTDGECLKSTELEYFEEALDAHDLASVASEWVVYDEDIERASAIDLVCKNKDGEYVIIDVKTRHKGIEIDSYKDKRMFEPLDDLPASRYYKYSLQISIYKYWLENKYDINVSDNNYILNLTDEGYELIPIVDLTEYVTQMYEKHD